MKILLFLLIFIISCASPPPEGKTAAEVLYKEAERLVKKSRFIMATEKLNKIKSEHPYSFYATPAELMLADVLYKQNKYVEAAASYIIFRDFHPKHSRSDYVLFKTAESFFQQIPDTSDRDLESAFEAMKYYKMLLQQYPNSSLNKDAKDKIAKAQSMIIEKEKSIADFYFKTEAYEAAMWRYKYILENIKDIEVVRHSMVRVIQSSLRSGALDECVHFGANFVPLFEKEERLKTASAAYQTCQEKVKTKKKDS